LLVEVRRRDGVADSHSLWGDKLASSSIYRATLYPVALSIAFSTSLAEVLRATLDASLVRFDDTLDDADCAIVCRVTTSRGSIPAPFNTSGLDTIKLGIIACHSALGELIWELSVEPGARTRIGILGFYTVVQAINKGLSEVIVLYLPLLTRDWVEVVSIGDPTLRLARGHATNFCATVADFATFETGNVLIEGEAGTPVLSLVPHQTALVSAVNCTSDTEGSLDACTETYISGMGPSEEGS